MLESRLDREAAHHGRQFADDARATAGHFYAVAAISKGLYYRLLMQTVGPSGRLLEYGCGAGGFSFEAAQADVGAIHAVDLSRVGVVRARQQAAVLGVGDRIAFGVMDAERLAYPDRSSDVVFGSGILHHLDLPTAVAEIVRVFQPHGTGVFFSTWPQSAA